MPVEFFCTSGAGTEAALSDHVNPVSALSLVFLIAALAIPSHAVELRQISFDDKRGLIWIPVRIGESKTLNFLFDSGAQQSVIDVKTAKNLGIRFVGSEVIGRVDGDERAHVTSTVKLQLGNITIWSAPLLAIDLRAESRAAWRKIDGLVGMDFMKGRSIRIDYRTGILELNPRADRGTGKVIPIQMHGGSPCVSVTLGDSTTLPKVRIDTGCNHPLHWSPIPVDREQGGGGGGGDRKTIGSSPRRMRAARADVVLGGIRIGKVATTRHSRPIFPGEQGLLGNTLLARFGVVTLDFRTQSLILGGG